MSEIFPEEDRCADPIDHACLIETRLRENDLAKARHKSKPEQEQLRRKDAHGQPLEGDEHLYWPITECVDCGDDIPTPRLNLAKIRCLICQEKLETKGRQYGRSEI